MSLNCTNELSAPAPCVCNAESDYIDEVNCACNYGWFSPLYGQRSQLGYTNATCDLPCLGTGQIVYDGNRYYCRCTDVTCFAINNNITSTTVVLEVEPHGHDHFYYNPGFSIFIVIVLIFMAIALFRLCKTSDYEYDEVRRTSTRRRRLSMV